MSRLLPGVLVLVLATALCGCTLRKTRPLDALIPLDALVPDAAPDAKPGDAHAPIDGGIAPD
jgi:hypothetical protein